MDKKIVIVLIVVAAILLIIGIAWEVLSAMGVITLEFDTSFLFLIAGFCSVFGAILASQSAAKGKKDSDKK